MIVPVLTNESMFAVKHFLQEQMDNLVLLIVLCFCSVTRELGYDKSEVNLIFLKSYIKNSFGDHLSSQSLKSAKWGA